VVVADVVPHRVMRPTVVMVADHVGRRGPAGGHDNMGWPAMWGLGNSGRRGEDQRGRNAGGGDTMEKVHRVLHFLDQM
jgi:hypothetical protein